MYERYYNLREPPFELTSNPRYLYLTPQHREALSNLEYGLSSAKAVTVLIGEAGTGKTTLLKAALGSDRCRDVQCVYVNNPALTRSEFIETLAERFELGPEASQSKAVLLVALENVLKERRRRGEITALVVDEAQTLSAELLEEMRLLANIETPSEKLSAAGARGTARAGAAVERAGSPPAQAAHRAALRAQAVRVEGDGDLYRESHPDRRRRSRASVHARGRHADPRAFARHPAGRSA